jgi:hypothetical protein
LEAEPGIIVVDSVAAMVPRAEQEESLDKATMALKGRLMSRGLANMNSLNKNTMIFIYNKSNILNILLVNRLLFLSLKEIYNENSLKPHLMTSKRIIIYMFIF